MALKNSKYFDFFEGYFNLFRFFNIRLCDHVVTTIVYGLSVYDMKTISFYAYLGTVTLYEIIKTFENRIIFTDNELLNVLRFLKDCSCLLFIVYLFFAKVYLRWQSTVCANY